MHLFALIAAAIVGEPVKEQLLLINQCDRLAKKYWNAVVILDLPPKKRPAYQPAEPRKSRARPVARLPRKLANARRRASRIGIA